MSSIYSIFDRGGALLLLMIALFLAIGQTAGFLLSMKEKRSGKQISAAALHLLAGFVIFVILLDGYDNVNFPTIPRDSVQTGWFVFSLPWLVYAAYELLSAAVLLLHFRQYRRYKTNTVTPDSIRRAIDLLPEGICVSTPDGTVRLANLRMDALCRELTGERLSDASRLWESAKEKGESLGERFLVRLNGEVWRFSREPLEAEGQRYGRTSAVNVTERYRITEELREKNAHLQEIRRRKKEAAELSGEMFVKQEEAAARSALHNELGQVLLMGRYCLEHPDSTDKSVVALMTRQMNRFLLGESRTPEQDDPDELSRAVLLAGSIGVSVEVRGETPRAGKARSLLAQAIRECAANTVKHAEGDRIEVILSGRSESKDLLITIRNNGRPPKGPIAESGGLLSLRRSAEAAGARMTVESQPAFALHISFLNTSNT